MLCTDPETLTGGDGELTTLLPKDASLGWAFGAFLGRVYGGRAPSASTAWVQPRDRYRGRCVSRDGATFLEVQPIGDAAPLTAQPEPREGLHMLDINIALGELEEVLAAQSANYLATPRLRVSVRGRRLAVSVDGPGGRRARVVLRRAGRRVSSRTVPTGRTARFRVRRAGTYRASAILLDPKTAPVRSRRLRVR